MPTLDDLRAAFGELERQAPAALSAPVRTSRRRQWTAIGLAAACTAAVAIAVPLTLGRGDDRTPPQSSPTPRLSLPIVPKVGFPQPLPGPAAGQSPDLAYRFAIPGSIAGYTTIVDLITGTYQHASIYGPTEPPGGQVFVFYGGTFDPATLQHREPVVVRGRTGYYADVRLPGYDKPAGVLAWEYADGGWAVIRLGVDYATPADKGAMSKSEREQLRRERLEAAAQNAAATQTARANEVLLAEAMVPANTPLRSPVRVADDSGYYVDAMSSSGPDGGLSMTGPGGSWHLGWGAETLHAGDKPTAGNVTIGMHEWIVYTSNGAPSSLGLIADGFGMTLTPDGDASLDDMKQFAARLDIAPDPGNPHTWFDAGANLP